MRKRTYRILGVLISIVLIATLFAACNSGDGGAQQPAAGENTGSAEGDGGEDAGAEGDGSAGGSMRVAWWGGQERADITQEVIEMFQAQNPGLNIDAEFTSFDGYWEKMSAMSAASNLPDVFQHDLRYIQHYVERGLLMEMSSYIGEGLDTSDISQVVLDGGSFDGVLYGVPLGTNMLCVVYDPQLFQEAGIDEPTNDWTWEDYAEICRAFREELDIYGDGEFFGVGYNGWQYVLAQQDQDMYSADGESLGFTDDAILTNMLALDNELYTGRYVLPPSIRVEIQDSESEWIVTQRAAMASVRWTNDFGTLVSASGRDLKLVLPPNASSQVRYGNYIKPSQFFTIGAATEMPDMAIKFVDFFTNDIDANLILRAERGVPISAKVRDALAEQLDESDKQVFDFIAEAEAYSGNLPNSTPSIHSEVESLISNIQFMIEEGDLTPEDAPAYFREEAEQLFRNKQ